MKLIDVLNKIANGELKEGTKVIIDSETFVYGYQNHIKVFSNEIRNEYLDVLQCLEDEVELIEPEEPTDNTKIEELNADYEDQLTKRYSIESIVNKLNEVIRKINTKM